MVLLLVVVAAACARVYYSGVVVLRRTMGPERPGLRAGGRADASADSSRFRRAAELVQTMFLALCRCYGWFEAAITMRDCLCRGRRGVSLMWSWRLESARSLGLLSARPLASTKGSTAPPTPHTHSHTFNSRPSTARYHLPRRLYQPIARSASTEPTFEQSRRARRARRGGSTHTQCSRPLSSAAAALAAPSRRSRGQRACGPSGHRRPGGGSARSWWRRG